jgi:phenylalanyl-tRNA synthetase alpha chain
MGEMNLAKELSSIEKSLLAVLKDSTFTGIEKLAKEANLNIDSARRAAEWLREKGLAELREVPVETLGLTAAGSSSFSKGLPEKMFVEAISARGGRAELGELKKESHLNMPEFNAAMGIAKKNAWISIRKEKDTVILELTGIEKDVLEGRYSLEAALAGIKEGGIDTREFAAEISELLRRGLAVKDTGRERELRLTKGGAEIMKILPDVGKRHFDIRSPAPRIMVGKRNPYIRFLSTIRRRLVELGFEQMDSPLVTQEFYNFDVLFQPQNHPARSWTDTYQLKSPEKGKLPEKRVVKAVAAAHENGGKTGSRGWGYKWNPEIAMKLMPTAHGTAHSARQLVRGHRIQSG